jgi:hypothetical protein
MKYTTILFLVICIFGITTTSNVAAQASDKNNMNNLQTVFEKDNNTTATYLETIDFYKRMAEQFSNIQVNEFGMTDSGYPLHEVIVTNDGIFDPKTIRENGKAVLFVNNAIHPGEPCGVDASMMLARDLMQEKEKFGLLNNTVIVLVPIYNISGSLNRGPHSRANQNGPKAYGFRGNAQNLDLNRDFIKGDTENSRSFNQLFTKWNPDVLIDNHTSNGADYQYVMTLIPTQKDKMDPSLSSYLQSELLPDLYARMKAGRYEMTPYVYVRKTPDEGIAGFLDYPRYSSGYANLHNCISFMPETHMLKPFKDRVWSTYDFMMAMLGHIEEKGDQILEARRKAIENTKTKSKFSLNWEMDMEKVDKIMFKGYEAKYKPSKVSGKDRLYYDKEAPYEKEIPFYNTYKSNLEVDKPIAYIVPGAYKRIVDRMKANGVEMFRLPKDEIREVEIYSILDYKTSEQPYEGHYLHSNLKVEKSVQNIQYHKGDYLIYTNQSANNYIVNTLEPQAPDSWFSWNFFDGILMQKEYFSAYVFEDIAAEFLEANPDVKEALEVKKNEDSEFANDGYAQLNFVYEKSPYYEPTYRRYPVGRVIK